MKLYHLLFGAAILAAAVPFILAAKGRDNYSDDEGMSADGWKRIWSRLTGKGGQR
ncbi:MAG TPA: hypothetical protein VMN38_00515 [Sphingomicrobium sp.]|nr:hypothetical protein [Sphingomicrobium sp.]